MKKIIPFLLLIITVVTSCKKDDSIDNEDQESGSVEGVLITATETCLYSDFDIQENTSVVINCLLDLEGQTITVPTGVTFSFEGGNIFNGILNFEGSGTIAGELLNSDLTVEGNVDLVDEDFVFYPFRWGIVEVEGENNPEPSSQVDAYNNYQIIKNTLNTVHDMGASVFTIGKLNAFFDCHNGEDNAAAAFNAVLFLPSSNFHLKMADNTYIRALPVNSILSSKLVKIYQSTNVNVSGGHLIGDRLRHGPTVGGSHVLQVTGAENTVIDNVSVSFAGDSGIVIQSYSFQQNSDYIPSQNVIVKNCTMDSNAKNNLQVTDGMDVIIEDCYSYRAGIDVETPFGTSEGRAPKIGILTETQVMQVVTGVIIRNNFVEDSYSSSNHDILTVGSTDIEISGNTAENSIGWSTSLNVRVTNNTSGKIYGGFLGFNGIDNIVSGNTVTNPDGVGIFLTDQNVEVYDNNLINCKVGIQLASLLNAEVYDNNFESNIENSVGILGQTYLDNVNVYDNDFALEDGKPLNILAINTEPEHEDYQFVFMNNIINASRSGIISGSSNITIMGNEFNGAGLGLSGTSNTMVKNNILINSSNGVTFGAGNSTDVEITGNTFEGTNDGTLSTAVTLSGSNIIFNDNIVKAVGNNNTGISVTEGAYISMENNTVNNESTFRSPLHFLGNNSTIINNTFINSNGLEGFFDGGVNNVFSGNN